MHGQRQIWRSPGTLNGISDGDIFYLKESEMDKSKQPKPAAAAMVNKHEKGMHPGKAPTKFAGGGGVKVRGTGAATKGLRARGPMG